MDVSKLLEAVALLVPPETATDNDITVDDVWDYLAQDDWEVALGLLEELANIRGLPLSFWETMAVAAEALHLKRSTAWCYWRCYEARNGVIRATLSLLPADASRRKTALPGPGVMRPLWNLGSLAPGGEPTFETARIWVEHRPSLEPGGRFAVRLAPLIPCRWQHLSCGDMITMHEGRPAAGTAVILEVQRAQG
ncbi:hypothetical protein [Streptacidiphilus sp. PAMC 29251]